MQDLSVFDGVDIEAAEAVCAQYGARLVSSSSLEEIQDLLEGERVGGVRVFPGLPRHDMGIRPSSGWILRSL